MTELPSVVALSGYAGSGKDETARILADLYGYRRIAFADKLKELVKVIDPIVGYTDAEDWRVSELIEAFGDTRAKKEWPEYRRLLQAVGVGCRDLFGPNFWVDQALYNIQPDELIVITDVRFPNEWQAVKDRGGVVWRIHRPGVGPVNNHISETALDDYPMNAVIENSGSLSDLKEQVKLTMSKYLNP